MVEKERGPGLKKKGVPHPAITHQGQQQGQEQLTLDRFERSRVLKGRLLVSFSLRQPTANCTVRTGLTVRPRPLGSVGTCLIPLRWSCGHIVRSFSRSLARVCVCIKNVNSCSSSSRSSTTNTNTPYYTPTKGGELREGGDTQRNATKQQSH